MTRKTSTTFAVLNAVALMIGIFAIWGSPINMIIKFSIIGLIAVLCFIWIAIAHYIWTQG